jgi:hypothetical protein
VSSYELDVTDPGHGANEGGDGDELDYRILSLSI